MPSLAEFNAWPTQRARAELLRCCGCADWAEAMSRRRPFRSKASLLSAADEEWARIGRAGWLEAFGRHPRIGGHDALRARFTATADWSRSEQSAVAAADEAVLEALERGNAEYEARFGHIFIVCASGKSASEMLALLKARLPNEPETETRLAATEQSKITKIRLEKLIP